MSTNISQHQFHCQLTSPQPTTPLQQKPNVITADTRPTDTADITAQRDFKSQNLVSKCTKQHKSTGAAKHTSQSTRWPHVQHTPIQSTSHAATCPPTFNVCSTFTMPPPTTSIQSTCQPLQHFSAQQSHAPQPTSPSSQSTNSFTGFNTAPNNRFSHTAPQSTALISCLFQSTTIKAFKAFSFKATIITIHPVNIIQHRPITALIILRQPTTSQPSTCQEPVNSIDS